MLYTFFDVETSGLERDCDVLSFSYMLADENLDVRRAETLYFWKEGVTKWTQEAFEVHGLSKEFLRQFEKDYDKNLQKMYIYLCYASLVGYNSGWLGSDGVIHGFDYARCKSFLYRNAYPEPRPSEFIDVMKLSASVLHREHKLGVAFQKMGLSAEIAQAVNTVYFGQDGRAHESSYDTVMTAMIFQKLQQEGMYKEGSGGVVWASDMEKQEKRTDWMLFFDGAELKVLSVVTKGGDEEDELSVMTVQELLDKDIKTFEFLMKNPESHMCLDQELLARVGTAGTEGVFIDV